MKNLSERYVKEFLDVIMLSFLERKPMSGNELITLIYENFRVLFSPGTVYPILHSMERSKLVVRKRQGKKKIYTITDKGRNALKQSNWIVKNLKTLKSSKQDLFSRIFQ